jgi:SIR2-like domain
LLTIIFGAGASYDSSTSHPPTSEGRFGAHDPNRLPLADELFAERQLFAEVASHFPRLLSILSELRHRRHGVSVEQQLESIQAEASDHPDATKQLHAVRYYLQWAIWECQRRWTAQTTRGVTNYGTLLNQIERHRKDEKVCLVTFNYDTLLEDAFRSIYKRFDSIDSYISGNDYSVFKLHGSVNWVHDLISDLRIDSDNVTMANKAVEAQGWDIGGQFYMAPESPLPISFMPVPGKGYQVVVPAIAIPVQKKNRYECPLSHVQVLTDLISQTDKLVIIGWRGAEENFNGLLARGVLFHKSIPIMVVSGSSDGAAEIVATFQSMGIKEQDWRPFDGGFTQLVHAKKIEDFIK